MNEEELSISIRKFLKFVGVSSQREIEHAVARAVQEGKLVSVEGLPARMTLEIPALGLREEFNGEIRLEPPVGKP